MAARNATNQKQRSALQKMVPVWRDFAEQHERMIHKSGKSRASAVCHRSIKGWM